jgi:type IV secretory pathway VirB4 component
VPWTYEHLKPKGKPDLLSDEVPWRAMLGPGVVLQKKDYALQRSYFVRGPDLVNESDEVQGATMLQANEVFKRLGGEWMLQSEAQRTRVTDLPPVNWPHPIPRLIDARRRDDMLVHRESRETSYYMTLTWVPPKPILKRGLHFFLRGPGRPGLTQEEKDSAVSVHEFISRADFLMDLLKGMLAVCHPLTSAKTATYLHNCVSDRWYALGDLDQWNDLDHQLCDTPLNPAGWYPELGNWHLRTMSVSGYPAESMTGIMRKLDAMNLDYRWSTRWIGMEKFVQQQFLKKAEARWVNQEKSAFDRSMENFTGHQTRVIDPDATNKALDVNAARQEIGMDLTAYGLFTSTVTVWDEDPLRVETKLTAVMQAFANQSFTVRAEDEHLMGAWLSSHPGNRHDNVRKTPQSALTLAHLAPGLNATWPGPERDDYLDEGPWFYCQTEGSTIFRVVNHLRTVGHFLMLGATGAGKSTVANFLRAMWMQQLNRQAKLFDLDGHGRLLTYLLGGVWYDLGSPALRLQPLRYIEEPMRYGLALQWLLDLLADYHVPRPDQSYAATQAYLGSNLRKLAQHPPAQRTLSRLVTLMADGSRDTELKARAGRIDAQGISHPDMELKALVHLQLDIRTVLSRFTAKGEFGGLFDGTEGDLERHPVQTFELASLKRKEAIMGPVMRYVLSQVDLQMTTNAPMLLLLDDAAVNWMIPEGQEGTHTQKAKLQEKVTEWDMTARKKSVSVGFITHSLSHVFNSAMGPLLLESCPSRFFLPNRAALEEDIGKIYRRMGLTDNAIRTIAVGRPQRDVFYHAREYGQRLVSLPFGEFELDCLARNSAEDHELMEKILEREGREGFAAAWLRACGWEEDAYAVQQWHQRRAENDEGADVSGRHADVARVGSLPD